MDKIFFKKGESVTIGFLLNSDYDMTRIQSASAWVGGKKFDLATIDHMLRCELASDETHNLSGNYKLMLWIDDVNLGVKKTHVADVEISVNNASDNNTSINHGYDFVFSVVINEISLVLGGVVYNYVKGDKGISAYQSYIATTTDDPKLSESDWVASLIGADGVAGATGADGKSAYQSAQDGGYIGNESKFNLDLADVSNKQNQLPTDAVNGNPNKFYNEQGNFTEIAMRHSGLRGLNDDTNYLHTTQAQQAAWDAKQNALGFTPENVANKGVANGYAPLDSASKVPVANLPSSLAVGAIETSRTQNTDKAPSSKLLDDNLFENEIIRNSDSTALFVSRNKITSKIITDVSLSVDGYYDGNSGNALVYNNTTGYTSTKLISTFGISTININKSDGTLMTGVTRMMLIASDGVTVVAKLSSASVNMSNYPSAKYYAITVLNSEKYGSLTVNEYLSYSQLTNIQDKHATVINITAVCGRKQKYFYNQFFLSKDNKTNNVPEGVNCHLVAKTSIISKTELYTENDGFIINAKSTSVGNYQYYFIVCDQYANILLKKEFSIKIVANNGLPSQKNILVIGDSWIDLNSSTGKGQTFGIYNFLANLNNATAPKMIGTRQAGNSQLYHEGRGGWSVAMYASNTANNPFWNTTTGVLDISKYKTDNNITKIDAVVISLGHNDSSGDTILNDVEIASLKTNTNKLLNAFISNDNTTKIIVSLNGLDSVDCNNWTNFTNTRLSSVYKINSFIYRQAVIEVVSSLNNLNIEVGQGTLSLSRFDHWGKVDKQEIRLPLNNQSDINFFKNFNFSGVQWFITPAWGDSSKDELSVIGFDSVDNSLICERFVNNTTTSYDAYLHGINYKKIPPLSGTMKSGWSSNASITSSYPINTDVLGYSNMYIIEDSSKINWFVDSIHPWINGYLAIGYSIGSQLLRMLS